MTIKRANIAKLMSEVHGASFVSLGAITVPTLRGGKANPFIGRTVKVMQGASVMVFQNKTVNGYEAMVKRRLVQEGKNPAQFELSPRKWGHRIDGCPFVEHKGNYYLEVIFLRRGDAHFEVDGVITAPEHITGLDLSREEADQGGLDNKVIIRTFSVESITDLVINKQRYENLTFKPLPQWKSAGSVETAI